ncbi:MAG: hypothetical protein QOD35_777 [Nocardioidaceae bacterium]|jgi:hypothetical protein|nr:hypothetical protein [Nocardioidaceae bacterium]
MLIVDDVTARVSTVRCSAAKVAEPSRTALSPPLSAFLTAAGSACKGS